jgi:hypothetical protein
LYVFFKCLRHSVKIQIPKSEVRISKF